MTATRNPQAGGFGLLKWQMVRLRPGFPALLAPWFAALRRASPVSPYSPARPVGQPPASNEYNA